MSKLEAAVFAYRNADNPSIDGRVAEGVYNSRDYQAVVDRLESEDILEEKNDGCYEIRFELPISDNGFFAYTLDDLLEKPSRKIKPPDEFYIASINYFYAGNAESAPGIVRQYLQAAELAKILVDLADLDASSTPKPKAVFLHGEKLELSLVYEINELKPVESLDSFIQDFIKADIHKDQKATIIKSVLLEMLKSNALNKLTLACLIGRFEEFYERVKANYQLYVSEFSFEKIKSQVEKERLDFTIKLNKIISDIQNQLLAIPVALILVGSQMKGVDGFAAKNISIWSGSIVFSFFVSLLIRNQGNSLENIKMEIDHQWAYVSDKHVYVREKLKRHYDSLQYRYYIQRVNLFLVSAVVSLGVLGSTFYLFKSSGASDLFLIAINKGLWGGMVYCLIPLAWWVTKKAREKRD